MQPVAYAPKFAGNVRVNINPDRINNQPHFGFKGMSPEDVAPFKTYTLDQWGDKTFMPFSNDFEADPIAGKGKIWTWGIARDGSHWNRPHLTKKPFSPNRKGEIDLSTPWGKSYDFLNRFRMYNLEERTHYSDIVQGIAYRDIKSGSLFVPSVELEARIDHSTNPTFPGIQPLPGLWITNGEGGLEVKFALYPIHFDKEGYSTQLFKVPVLPEHDADIPTLELVG